jgi:predicted nucleic acid-binding protein
VTGGSGLYLVDSSVWIATLRGDARLAERIDELAAVDRIATTGLVRVEVLRGVRDVELQRVGAMFDSLHQLATDEAACDEAILLGRRLRTVGRPPPGADLVIATVAILHDAILVHRDADYEAIAQHTALRTESHF